MFLAKFPLPPALPCPKERSWEDGIAGRTWATNWLPPVSGILHAVLSAYGRDGYCMTQHNGADSFLVLCVKDLLVSLLATTVAAASRIFVRS